MQIPDFLKHLLVDGRGYPIPFFVAFKDGKPDFRLLDQKKQRKAFLNDLCGICGKPLDFPISYTINGPQGLKNLVSQDPLMHKECAEYSLSICPHLYFEKAQRRETGEGYKEIVEKNPKYLIKEKPTTLYLIRAMCWEIISLDGHWLYKYKSAGSTKYIYENGTLIKT